jgi:hypothetical protein
MTDDFLQKALERLRGLQMDRDDHGEPVPVVLPLDEEGLQILDKVRLENFDANQSEGGLIGGWRGKNDGRLLRLGLVIEHLEWAGHGTGKPPERVSAASVNRAANYLDYADKMMQRCLGELALTNAQRDAAKIARLIQKELALTDAERAAHEAAGAPRLISATDPRTINERDLYKSGGFHALRDKERRKDAFAELVARAWVRHQARGTWLLNPKLKAALLNLKANTRSPREGD